jgi:flagellar motor component MotA
MATRLHCVLRGTNVDSGFYAACAGLRAQSQALEVAGHNLANLNTTGFSPTIGIIGAVLGLIQVMQHLDKIDEVGKGIAVAFVATLYGVGAANLILLPAAGKLKIRIRDEQIIREMTIEGVVSIIEGMNPHMLETKLLGFLTDAHERPVVPEEPSL